MSQPLVSVIIPTYNRTHFLKETLNSIVSQTYSNIEIIIVDDGTPGDENKKLSNAYNNLTYIKIENSGGPAKPRNIGLSNSKGEYIAFVDDDDLWLPKKIETQVNILENNQDFDLVHCSCHVIDKNGIKTGEIIGKPRNQRDKHGDVLARMIGNWTIMMPTPLISKNLISKVGLFNENIPPALEDVEYWSRCAFHTKFYFLDEPLVNYRKHSNNISTSKKKYIDLPLYLNEVVNKNRNMVSNKVYKKLGLNICLMQSKMIKTDFLRTLSNMFKINPFWFVNFRVQKTIIKKLTK